MSFAAANQAVQQFIINTRYAQPVYENIKALMNARRLNTTILETASERLGKLRKVKISQYPIDCDSVADSCGANLCDSGAKLEPVQEWFLISKCIQSKNAQLDVADLRLVDGNYNISQHAIQQIAAKLPALRRELASQIDTDLLAHAGLHLDGNTTKRITMSNTTSGLMTPLGMWEIEKEFADGGYMNPFILGATEVFNWKKSASIAAPNTTIGFNPAAAAGQVGNLYYDTVLNSVSGDTSTGEYVIAFDPQALKFVSFSENVGIFATEVQSPEQLDMMFKSGPTDRIKGAFFDPEYGIIWDFNCKFDPCAGDGEDGAFVYSLRLKWDIFYPVVYSCNVQGVNGIFVYKTCPVKIPTCPTGDTPSPAAVARNFNWVPTGVTYPFVLSDITIGGISSEPNIEIASLSEFAAAIQDAYNNQATFTTPGGGAIRYNGYAAIDGTANAGNITITFA